MTCARFEDLPAWKGAIRLALKDFNSQIANRKSIAESCSRQNRAWAVGLQNSEIKGRRHLNRAVREGKRTADAAHDFRKKFLVSLSPDHPLYGTPDAVAARQSEQKRRAS